MALQPVTIDIVTLPEMYSLLFEWCKKHFGIWTVYRNL